VAIFSVVYATFLAPVPYRDAERLVLVWSQFEGDRSSTSAPDYVEWRRQGDVFEDLVAWTGRDVNLATPDRPEHVRALHFGGWAREDQAAVREGLMVKACDFLLLAGSRRVRPGLQHRLRSSGNGRRLRELRILRELQHGPDRDLQGDLGRSRSRRREAPWDHPRRHPCAWKRSPE
jgi:hypothetical protein